MSKEIRARVEQSAYLVHLNETYVTVAIPGEHDITRAENVVIVVNEAGK